MPPANDDFASATDLGSATSGEITFDITGATTESGEPGFAYGPTVWFKWTAPADARIRFDTSTTPAPRWDSFIGLFTGTSFADLVEVGYNDDGTLQPGAIEPDTFGTSTVDQYVTAGTVYWIQIGSYDYTAWDDTDGHHDSAGFPRTDCHLRWKPSPPDGIIFTNTSFGALRIGDTLDVTSYSGFTAVDRVNFTGASAIPTIIDDTHLTVVVPTTAVVGPVSFHSTDWGTIDSGYVAFYPWITLAWHDPMPFTWGPLHLDNDGRDVNRSSGDYVDNRWDRGLGTGSQDAGLGWMATGDVVGSFGPTFADAADAVDNGGRTGEVGTDPEQLNFTVSAEDWDGKYQIANFGMLLDLNVGYSSLPDPPERFSPDFTDLPLDVYHPGDPGDYEYEDEVAADVQWLTWMTDWQIDIPLNLQQGLDTWTTVAGTIQARIVPVADLEYDGSDADISPRQGRFFTGTELAGYTLLAELDMADAPDTATMSITIDPDQVRQDEVHGTHALVVLCFKDQVTGATTLDGNEVMSFGIGTPLSADLQVTFNYTLPRWRYVVPQYGPLVPPPQRQYPRDDGLAISTRRSWPPPTSKQYGSRRGPTATYW